jgi:hypothetical protein
MSYDSGPETREHINRVRSLLMQVVDDLNKRGWKHDASKLEEPEKSIFDEFSPKLRAMTYSVDPESEYQMALGEMSVGLRHHYEHNDHHPEFDNGMLNWMNLIQIIEMLADWKAAGERHAGGGDLRRSIETNQERFGYGDEVKQILLNTAEYLGWL